jgi:2-polyprenyl-6-methoxyphenol hydroxylase-like FAD-dependent oxidoreductase
MTDKAGALLSALVVGAGPIGLTMALDLTLRGIKCRIIDKLEQPSDKSKAIAIHSRTTELFEGLGIVQEFLDAGHKIHGTNIYSGKTKLVHLSMDEIGGSYPFALAVPQNVTEKILTDELIRHGVYVERGVELIDFTDSGDFVTVNLKHGNGDSETVPTSWLLGCDGAHSTVRHRLNLGFEGGVYERPFATVDCYVEWNESEDELFGFISDGGGVFFFPLGNKRYRIVADGKPGSSKHDLTLEEMQAIVDEHCYPGIKLRDPIWLAWFNINHRSVEQYRKGRVFVAGDAAHVHSPALGQGMNTGMQDAINLAWKIELVEKEIADPKLLDSYNLERHPIGQALLKRTDLVTKMITIRSPIGQSLRNRLMPLLAEQEVIQHRALQTLSMIGLNYRHSSIVAQHRDGIKSTVHPVNTVSGWLDFNHGPMPGDRAPDGDLSPTPTSSETTLLGKLHGVNHNILLFAGLHDSGEALREIDRVLHEIEATFEFVNCHIVLSGGQDATECKSAHSVLIDPDGALHHKYGAAQSCLYLVRPDGYIGFRSQPVEFEALRKYFTDVFGMQVLVETAKK